MDKKKLQDEYRILINEKRFFELLKLIKETNIKPAEYLVRIGIKSYLDEKRALKTRLFYIIKLIEITSIDLDPNIIQTVCKLMLDLGTPYTLELFSKITKINKEIFKNIKDDIQRQYTNYIEEGKLIEISKLIDICYIAPSENIIIKGYRTFLLEGNIISFINLKNRVNIEPTERLIQEILFLYKNKTAVLTGTDGPDPEDYWYKRTKKLKKVLGMDPED